MGQRLPWVALSFGAGFLILNMMPNPTAAITTIPNPISNLLSPKNAKSIPLLKEPKCNRTVIFPKHRS